MTNLPTSVLHCDRAGNTIRRGAANFLAGLAFFVTLVAFAASSHAMENSKMDLENTLYLELKDGRVVIELRPDLAPNHVARIKELVRQKFYDGLLFHRVIRGFMAQTGDPSGDGTGGSGTKLMAEFSEEPHIRGSLSMARGGNPDSADSQFFICFDRSPHLDGQYTFWGQVVDGMEHVDNIKMGIGSMNGVVRDPDSIISMSVAADVQ